MDNNGTQGFSFDLPKGNSSIIKVIGVGGGGNNALMHMYEKGIHGVDFIICNTDAQTLDNNPVANKVQLGVSITEGLGAGADPEVGEKSAIESIDDIKAALGQNTKMVFITAGMGGGTGTGAAPVIAKIAKEMGILTVGIVTVPFSFEGKRRLDQAENGLDKLRNNVDSLIVINNDKLRQQFGNLGFKQGFSKADEVLTNAAKGMAEVITAPFTINIDFRDAKSVLQNSGTALMSTGVATGEKRAEEAVRKALDSPLLNDNKITGAKDVLLLIQSGDEESAEATMDEIGLINDYIQSEAGNTANIIFGVGTDAELGDAIKVLVIATGFAKDNNKHAGVTEKIKFSLTDSAEQRESPFKSSFAADEAPAVEKTESKNVFRLDADEDAGTFQGSAAKTTGQNATEFKVVEKDNSTAQELENFGGDDRNEYNLFSFEEKAEGNNLEAESFTFETEELPKFGTPEEEKTSTLQNFSEEKEVEFSFFVNEPINEPKEVISETFSEIKQEPVQNQVEKAAEITEKPVEAVAEEEIEETKEPVQEIPVKEKEFTFVEKTRDEQRSMERRNKLKEFNSRYQVNDTENEFEKVPAFKRKNIAIDGQNASEQRINSFLSENKDGEMQIRANRFLNKDVD